MSIGKSPTQYKGVLAKQPPNVIFAQRAPVTGTDVAFRKGDLWVDSTNLASYQFAGDPAGTWIALGTGAVGGVVTLTGGSGGARSPTAGNINLLGTASQITSTGSGSTITFSIPAAFIAPGSIASTTTVTSGTALIATTTVTAGTGITATTGNITATAGSVNAGTSITATLGNITATNGNIVRGTAGNKDIYSSVASTTTAGANSAGKVTLVAGTATISTTAVTTNSIIRLTRQGVGATGAAALGMLSVGTIVNATSFVINAWSVADATALATTDVSSIGWEIVN